DALPPPFASRLLLTAYCLLHSAHAPRRHPTVRSIVIGQMTAADSGFGQDGAQPHSPNTPADAVGGASSRIRIAGWRWWSRPRTPSAPVAVRQGTAPLYPKFMDVSRTGPGEHGFRQPANQP